MHHSVLDTNLTADAQKTQTQSRAELRLSKAQETVNKEATAELKRSRSTASKETASRRNASISAASKANNASSLAFALQIKDFQTLHEVGEAYIDDT